LYLKYIRFRIYRIRNVQDIITLIKNIAYFYEPITSDNICNILVDCLNLYPLSAVEMQKISVLQQHYDLQLGIENYATFIMWVSCVHSILEKPTTRLLN